MTSPQFVLPAVAVIIAISTAVFAKLAGVVWKQFVKPPKSPYLQSPDALIYNLLVAVEFAFAAFFLALGHPVVDHVITFAGALAIVVLTTHAEILFRQWLKRKRASATQERA